MLWSCDRFLCGAVSRYGSAGPVRFAVGAGRENRASPAGPRAGVGASRGAPAVPAPGRGAGLCFGASRGRPGSCRVLRGLQPRNVRGGAERAGFVQP